MKWSQKGGNSTPYVLHYAELLRCPEYVLLPLSWMLHQTCTDFFYCTSAKNI